jgi:hypothetical protein
MDAESGFAKLGDSDRLYGAASHLENAYATPWLSDCAIRKSYVVIK